MSADRSRPTAVPVTPTGSDLPAVVALPGPALMADGQAAVVAFSTDGARLFTGGGHRDAALLAWDVQGGTAVGDFPAGSPTVSALAVSPDGNQLASCDVSPTVLVWDIGARALATRLTGHDRSVYSLAWDATGQALIAIDSDGQLVRWQLARPDKPRVIDTGARATGGLAVARDRRVIATSDRAGAVLRDPAEFSVVQKIGSGRVTQLAFDDAGDTLYVADETGHTITAHAVDGGRVTAVFKGHAGTVNALVGSPDGRRLISGAGDGTVRVWDASTGASLAVLSAPGMSAVWSVAVSRDGQLVAAAGNGRTVGLWRLPTYEPIHGPPASGHRDTVTSLAWSPDGHLLAAGDAAGQILVRSASDWSVATALSPRRARIDALAFAPAGDTLLSAADGMAQKWDATTFAPGAAFPVHRGVALAYSPDGRHVAVSDASRVVELRSATTGAVVRMLGSNQGLRQNLMRPTSVCFSPDSKYLATARWDEAVHIYERKSGRLVREVDGFMNVAWSPDGQTLAASFGQMNKRERDIRLRLWRTDSWSAAGELDATGPIYFTPDGRHLVGPDDTGRALHFWSLTDRTVQATARAPFHGITSLALSPDGTRLATGGNRGDLYVWDATLSPGN